MAGNGASGGAGFVNASAMLPGGSAFALATTAGASAVAVVVADDDVESSSLVLVN